MKAIILTYSPIDKEEKNILTETCIYKIALNHHAKELKPDVRFISDYILTNICKNFPEKIVSTREVLRCPSKRIEYFSTEFKGATIISAAEYLIVKGYNEILVVGNNTVNNSDFQRWVKEEFDILKEKVKIYQYSHGNFNLPIKSIKEFCS